MNTRQNTPVRTTGRLSLILVFLLGFNSCLPSIRATSAFDRNASFQVYRTFSILEPEAAGTSANPTAFEPLLDRRVRDAVASELVKKGLTPDAESPDLLIAYDVAVAQDTNLVRTTTDAPGLGYSYWYGYRYNYITTGFPGYRSTDAYPVGTLIIDLIDSRSNELVWRGWAEGEIDAAQTEVKKIRRSIASILAQYPPGGTAR
ncbi:hypothetical protein OB13_09370 [Pontibacter sp. HJ8]